MTIDWQSKKLPASPVGEQAAEVPCLIGWQGGGEKIVGSLCPRGKPQTQFFSGPRSFPVPLARRRTSFSPVRAEDASYFISRRRRINSSQLLKGRSENF
jgi:hypothetical protein